MVTEQDVPDNEEGRGSELPALRQLESMGYEYKPARRMNSDGERESTRDVILHRRLSCALERLNPELSKDEVNAAMEQLREGRHTGTLVDINEKFHAMLVGLSRSGGLVPVTVVRTDSGTREHVPVKVIDFDNVENNDFLVTNQFVVSGHNGSIKPDIVAFVNGIPLVVIECKSPTAASPITDAYAKNLSRYQRAKTGHERLFYYNHVLVAACGIDAKVGTVGSDIGKYSPWRPYVSHEAQGPRDGKMHEQEATLESIMDKKTLLDTLENFVLYDHTPEGKTKMVARLPQYRAVTESLRRIGSGPGEQGGVIWHTQGSGKSLSMLWLATIARRRFKNIPVMVITDRRQLDMQITSVFTRHRITDVIQAHSKKELAQLLKSPKRKIIMAVIDKFGDLDGITEERAICLVDEAHRSQFREKAAHMRHAIPNGMFFAFTGTPLRKRDRDTYAVFGTLVDRYGFKESQADRTTLPIAYSSRLPRLYLDDAEGVDEMFERVFSGLDPDAKREIQGDCVTRRAIIESKARIAMVARDIVEHYQGHIEPDGFKAMLVTSSRLAAMRYKDALDSIEGHPESAVIMSRDDAGDVDMAEYAKYDMTQHELERAAEDFKLEKNPTKILIVVDMLLVGYDAPICKAMYLDKGLREHNLLQAIARVNRTYGEVKTRGIIIDYYGVTREMSTALAGFDSIDIGGALGHADDIYEELDEARRVALGHFVGVGRKDHGRILERFGDEYKRAQFRRDFGNFARILNAALPDGRAREYTDDLRFMGGIMRMLATYYGGPRPDTRVHGAKVREIIDRHVAGSEIRRLIDDEPIPHGRFLEAIKDRFSSASTRAALMIHRIKTVIVDIGHTDPDHASSLRERLERIIREEKSRRIKSPDELDRLLRELYGDCVNFDAEIVRIFGGHRATRTELSMYHALEPLGNRQERARLSMELFRDILPKTQIIDWEGKSSIRKEIRKSIYEKLKRQGLDEDTMDELAQTILDRVRALHAGPGSSPPWPGDPD